MRISTALRPWRATTPSIGVAQPHPAMTSFPIEHIRSTSARPWLIPPIWWRYPHPMIGMEYEEGYPRIAYPFVCMV